MTKKYKMKIIDGHYYNYSFDNNYIIKRQLPNSFKTVRVFINFAITKFFSG